MSSRLSVRKRLAFASAAAALAVAVPLGAALAADLYLHHKVEKYAGVNIWGYRGPTVPKKQPGEFRIVVLGGSTAFGYGVDWQDAFPALLERDLRPLARGPVSVVNLGMSSQGAYSFRFTLEDYLSLDYDLAILYEGYNDMGDKWNYFVGRRDSPVFRLTGYYPILPVYLQEKAMVIRSGGHLDEAYRGKAVFRPGLADRTTAGALEASAKIGEAVTRELDRFAQASAIHGDRIRVVDRGCRAPFDFYCDSVYDGVAFALAHQTKVLVVTQPYGGPAHRDQQQAMRTMLQKYFAGNRSVGYANLGEAVDLRDTRVVYDGLHLNRDGNAIIARDLVGPVTMMAPEEFHRPGTTPDVKRAASGEGGR